MKTETRTYEVYTFDELTPEIQQKVIDRYRSDDYPTHEWWDYTFEQFAEARQEEGWDTTTNNIYFRLAYSQGDGACFEGSLNIQKYLEHFKLEEKYPLTLKYVDEFNIYAKIHKNSYATYYDHENTRYAEIDSDWIDSAHGEEVLGGMEGIKALETELEALEKDIEEERYNLSRGLYRTLQDEYEELTSDESIAEEIRANEMEFLANGEPFN